MYLVVLELLPEARSPRRTIMEPKNNIQKSEACLHVDTVSIRDLPCHGRDHVWMLWNPSDVVVVDSIPVTVLYSTVPSYPLELRTRRRQRIATLAKLDRTIFDPSRSHLVDAVTFQYSTRCDLQDCFVVWLEALRVKWTFMGALDGALLFRSLTRR